MCNVQQTYREAINSLKVHHQKSKKKPTVALSTCEAEYMALAKATQEGLFLTQLLNKMDPLQEYTPVKILRDNQRTKYHFIRNALLNSSVNTIYCSTADMLRTLWKNQQLKQN